MGVEQMVSCEYFVATWEEKQAARLSRAQRQHFPLRQETAVCLSCGGQEGIVEAFSSQVRATLYCILDLLLTESPIVSQSSK